MTLTNNETQVTWPTAANSISVAASSVETSEEVTINATVVDGSIALRGDNAGTPASGDTLSVYIIYSNGDVTGAGGSDTFGTDTSGHLLAVLDTNVTDPRETVVSLPTITAKKFKLYAVNDGATRAIVITARLMDKRSA